MPTIKLDVLFKKHQKDDKKEVLEMHILDDGIKNEGELLAMAGKMVVLQVNDIQEIPVEFKGHQKDSKKTVMKFQVRGNFEEATTQIYLASGKHATVYLAESQLSIEDVMEAEEDGDDLDTFGAIAIDDGQMTIEEVEPEEVNFDDPQSLAEEASGYEDTKGEENSEDFQHLTEAAHRIGDNMKEHFSEMQEVATATIEEENEDPFRSSDDDTLL